MREQVDGRDFAFVDDAKLNDEGRGHLGNCVNLSAYGDFAITRALLLAGPLVSPPDPLARVALWEAGLDYDHGTGRGVGHFRNVHEGPNHLPAGPRPGETGIEAGMILSNEPGCYKPREYGIRPENLVVVTPRQIEDGDKAMLGFETISWALMDRELIDPALLTRAESDWLNDYHTQVLRYIEPLVVPEMRSWLEQQAAPLDACPAILPATDAGPRQSKDRT